MMKIYILLALFLLPNIALAQQGELIRSVTVQGKAEEEVKPDRAVIQVRIQNTSKTLEETKRLQDKQIVTFADIVKELKIPQQYVRTHYSRLNPHYEYDREKKKRIFKGYRAETSLEVKLRQLDRTGPLLDKMVKAGFDHVGNVRYILDDDQALRDAVLLKALDNARAKAKGMAKRVGDDLGKALTINEGYVQTPKPYLRSRYAAKSVALESVEESAAPVAPPEGLIKITGTVHATFELED